MHRITILLILISVNFLYAQSFSLKEKKSLLFNLQKNNRNFEVLKDSSLEKNLKNFPFQIGLEAGGSVAGNKTSNYGIFVLIGSFDFNLFRKIIHFKLELGAASIKNYEEILSSYVSLGLNLKILNIDKSRLFLHGGISGIRNSRIRNEESFSLIFSMKYVYVVSELIGISLAVKTLFAGSFNPLLTLGVNLFNQ